MLESVEKPGILCEFGIKRVHWNFNMFKCQWVLGKKMDNWFPSAFPQLAVLYYQWFPQRFLRCAEKIIKEVFDNVHWNFNMFKCQGVLGKSGSTYSHLHFHSQAVLYHQWFPQGFFVIQTRRASLYFFYSLCYGRP